MLAAVDVAYTYELTFAGSGNHGHVALEMTILYPGIRTAYYVHISTLKCLSRIVFIQDRKPEELCRKDDLQ
jgi:hypothetical protein